MQNFGELNHVVMEFLAEGVSANKETNKKLFKKFMRTLRENKVLRDEFLVYNNLQTKVSSTDASISEFIQENVKLMDKYSKKQINEANMVLAKLIASANVENPESPFAKLYEAIHQLMVEKANLNNIDTRLSAKDVITEHIKNNKLVKSDGGDYMPPDLMVKIMVGNFNRKYEKLNEDTKTLLRQIIKAPAEERETIFIGLVRECIDLVNENIGQADLTVKEKLLSTKDKLLRLKYDGETFITEAAKLLDLKVTLK
tara:strand:+ start:6069 stop:6836 length:768 start_codon:yes stop_codon:yes gene_type:complete